MRRTACPDLDQCAAILRVEAGLSQFADRFASSDGDLDLHPANSSVGEPGTCFDSWDATSRSVVHVMQARVAEEGLLPQPVGPRAVRPRHWRRLQAAVRHGGRRRRSGRSRAGRGGARGDPPQAAAVGEAADAAAACFGRLRRPPAGDDGAEPRQACYSRCHRRRIFTACGCSLRAHPTVTVPCSTVASLVYRGCLHELGGSAFHGAEFFTRTTIFTLQMLSVITQLPQSSTYGLLPTAGPHTQRLVSAGRQPADGDFWFLHVVLDAAPKRVRRLLSAGQHAGRAAVERGG